MVSAVENSRIVCFFRYIFFLFFGGAGGGGLN